MSLDCAIVDLSDKVFSAGMAYVALSRVRSLAGLHLAKFDPKSVIVSTDCLQEMNRLRQMWRKDLPLYSVPQVKKSNIKTAVIECHDNDQLTAVCRKRKLPSKSVPAPSAKRAKEHRKRQTSDMKASQYTDSAHRQPSKKTRSSRVKLGKRTHVYDDSGIDLSIIDIIVSEPTQFHFHPVDEEWQRSACRTVGVQFHRASSLGTGGHDVPLTEPDPATTKSICGDGNCLFRSFSYILTGSERQHMAVRLAIVEHMKLYSDFFIQHTDKTRYTSMQQYIEDKEMNQTSTWGTDVEILAMAHLLKTCVYIYDTEEGNWLRYSPCHVDRSLQLADTQRAMYILHPPDHYDVVRSTVK